MILSLKKRIQDENIKKCAHENHRTKNFFYGSDHPEGVRTGMVSFWPLSGT